MPKLTPAQCEIERDPEDGTWWVYYPKGWKSSSDPLGNQHQDHEDTKREIFACIKSAEPCDCEDCR